MIGLRRHRELLRRGLGLFLGRLACDGPAAGVVVPIEIDAFAPVSEPDFEHYEDDGPAFLDTPAPLTLEPTEAGTTVREAVLSSLKLAGASGIKAAVIRADYESRHGTQLHDKTIGMTLYRLSRDGLARREGRTWFYVPPDSGTKNPGAATPGQTNIFE